jgi:hypothetical protein
MNKPEPKPESEPKKETPPATTPKTTPPAGEPEQSDRELIADTKTYSPTRWKRIAKAMGLPEDFDANNPDLDDETAKEIADACRKKN